MNLSKIDENLSYEDAFAQLEELLGQLESGDLPLEEALALYEKGAAWQSEQEDE